MRDTHHPLEHTSRLIEEHREANLRQVFPNAMFQNTPETRRRAIITVDGQPFTQVLVTFVLIELNVDWHLDRWDVYKSVGHSDGYGTSVDGVKEFIFLVGINRGIAIANHRS